MRADEGVKQARIAALDLAHQVIERLNIQAEALIARAAVAAPYAEAEEAAARKLERLTREVAAVSGSDERSAAKQVDDVLVGRAA